MEGFMPAVPEFLVCAEHAKDGEALLAGCTFMAIGDVDGNVVVNEAPAPVGT